MEFSSSSFIILVHLPQYHIGSFLMVSTTFCTASQPSLVKYFLNDWISTFSSIQQAVTLSGSTSTPSSLINPFWVRAISASSGSTNHCRITIACCLKHYYTEHVGMIPLSLSTGNFFKNGVDFSDFFYFFGSPMTVLSAPFGLPLFFNLGGNVTSWNPVRFACNSLEIQSSQNSVLPWFSVPSTVTSFSAQTSEQN